MGQVISDQFVQNAMALGERWREQRRMGKVTNAMSTWNTDPDGTIAKVMQIDPDAGLKLEQAKGLSDYRKAAAQEQSAEANTRTQAVKMSNLKSVVGLLDGAANATNGADPSTNVGTAFDQVTPILKNTFGMNDQDIQYYRGALTQNPGLIKVLKQRLDPEKPILSAPGDDLLSPTGDVLHHTDATPKPGQVVQVRDGNGGVHAYVFDPNTNTFVSPTTGQPAPGQGGGGSGGPLTSQDAWNFISKHEGSSLVHNDGNGYPAKFGFNQKWNPDIDVSQLDATSAANRYATTRFPAEVANMPRPLALAYADSNFMNPGKAKQWLADSNGDPNKFMQLREAWLAKQPNGAAYASRNADLRQQMGLSGGGSTDQSGGGAPQPFITTPGKSPAGGHELSPDEVTNMKLDPTYQYWIKNDGSEPKIIGPAHKAPPKGSGGGSSLAQTAMIDSQLDNTVKTVDQLYNHQGLPGIVGMEGKFPDYPGGHAADADALLKNLRSQIGLNVLQALRASSKTGGALGRVSNFEMQTLQDNLAAIDKSQSLGQFQQQLTRLKANLMGMRQRLDAAAAADQAAGPGSGGGGFGSPPVGAIQLLKQNPSGAIRLQFDKKYGPGAAKRVLGTASITTDMPIGQKTPYGTRI